MTPFVAITVDWTVNIFNILTGLVAVGGFIFGAGKLAGRLSAIESVINEHGQKFLIYERQYIELVRQLAQLAGALQPLNWPRPFDSKDPSRLP